MSATFKNSKKKLSQSELRKCMQEHKTKNRPIEKINSPLAKYNESGQLTCILCQSVVRSEAVWNVHVNAKQHRQNVESAKALKEKTNNFTTAAKRAASPPPSNQVPAKKIKGILKNSTTPSSAFLGTSNIVVVENNETKRNSKTKSDETEKVGSSTVKNVAEELPKDFFDPEPTNTNANGKKKKNKNRDNDEPGKATDEEAMDVDSEALPEGFFDDPKLDAKARNIEFKDPIEEEWERFQKEIKDADHASNAIIAEDQDEATTERQIDEIEEQMKNWSRVVVLEKKKVGIIQHVGDVHMQVKHEDDSSASDMDDDIDEFLDWRSKRAYK